MKIGLFIDVDGVLTEEPVNLQIARILGVEKELIEIEQKFAKGIISNDEFNREFVPLFRKANFSQKLLVDNFNNIHMRIGYEKLLSIVEDTYVLSSGPSYFVEFLKEKFNFPADRVLCSRYEFCKRGILLKCVDAVSSMKKADWVRPLVRDYDIVIGIGDKPEQDSAFLSHCDIRILMDEFRIGYLSVREIEPVINLIKNMSEIVHRPETAIYDKFEACRSGIKRLLQNSSYEKNVFIITPFREDARYREMVRTIKDELAKSGLRAWIASEMRLDKNLWTNVQCFMLGCKYGIAIFTRTEERSGDVIQVRKNIYNPNISIEAGFMLSRGKEVLLLKDKQIDKLPTDIVGSLYEDFDLDDAERSIRAVLSEWVKGI